MNFLERYLPVIFQLCKAHKVKTLYAFGSVLSDRFSPDSDVDLIVEFDPMEVLDYSDNYFDLKFALQDVLNRPIDLLEEKAVKNPYFKEALHRQRRLVYDGHGDKNLAIGYLKRY